MPQVQRLLEEYYKLDYEDVVGGVRTRFRWAAGTPHVLWPAGWPAGWLDGRSRVDGLLSAAAWCSCGGRHFRSASLLHRRRDGFLPPTPACLPSAPAPSYVAAGTSRCSLTALGWLWRTSWHWRTRS